MPNIIPFCPIPIYQGSVSFTEEDYENLTSSEMHPLSAGNGYSSKSSYVLNDSKFNLLRQKICLEVNNFLHEQLRIDDVINFELQNSWVVKHNRGDWAHRHCHKNSMISGILYLNVDQNSGSLIFHKDNGWENIFPKMIEFPYKDFNNLNALTWAIKPKIGEIVLFPSHLDHSVTENLSHITRYCLAFNFFARGTFGVYRGDYHVGKLVI